MAYEPTTWKSGDVVTSAKLNKIEGGIKNASALTVTMTDTDQSTYRLDKTYAEILSAVESGQFVQVKYVDETNYVNLYILQQIYVTSQGAYSVAIWNNNDGDYFFVAQSADGVLETLGD